jgi:hypothetical protein
MEIGLFVGVVTGLLQKPVDLADWCAHEDLGWEVDSKGAAAQAGVELVPISGVSLQDVLALIEKLIGLQLVGAVSDSFFDSLSHPSRSLMMRA